MQKSSLIAALPGSQPQPAAPAAAPVAPAAPAASIPQPPAEAPAQPKPESKPRPEPQVQAEAEAQPQPQAQAQLEVQAPPPVQAPGHRRRQNYLRPRPPRLLRFPLWVMKRIRRAWKCFGGYSFMNAGTDALANRQNVGGFESSVAYNINHWLAAEGNADGYYKTITIIGVGTFGFNDYLIAAGPRLTVRKLFIHALVGMDHQANNLYFRRPGAFFRQHRPGGRAWRRRAMEGSPALRGADLGGLRTQPI